MGSKLTPDVYFCVPFRYSLSEIKFLLWVCLSRSPITSHRFLPRFAHRWLRYTKKFMEGPVGSKLTPAKCFSLFNTLCLSLSSTKTTYLLVICLLKFYAVLWITSGFWTRRLRFMIFTFMALRSKVIHIAAFRPLLFFATDFDDEKKSFTPNHVKLPLID